MQSCDTQQARNRSYLLREPVRWSARFCKWFDGSAHRDPFEMNTNEKEISTQIKLPYLKTNHFLLDVFVNPGKNARGIKTSSIKKILH